MLWIRPAIGDLNIDTHWERQPFGWKWGYYRVLWAWFCVQCRKMYMPSDFTMLLFWEHSFLILPLDTCYSLCRVLSCYPQGPKDALPQWSPFLGHLIRGPSQPCHSLSVHPALSPPETFIFGSYFVVDTIPCSLSKLKFGFVSALSQCLRRCLAHARDT